MLLNNTGVFTVSDFSWLGFMCYCSVITPSAGQRHEPSTAAATQCLRWSLIVALIIVLGLLALSGFSFSNFAATLANNLGFIIFIVVLWFAYLIIILSNKSKGEAK